MGEIDPERLLVMGENQYLREARNALALVVDKSRNTNVPAVT